MTKYRVNIEIDASGRERHNKIMQELTYEMTMVDDQMRKIDTVKDVKIEFEEVKE